MTTRRIVSLIISSALIAFVACAVGSVTAAFTGSWVWAVVAAVVAGLVLVVGWIFDVISSPLIEFVAASALIAVIAVELGVITTAFTNSWVWVVPLAGMAGLVARSIYDAAERKSGIISTALSWVVLFAVGFLTAAFTDSWVWAVVATGVAGLGVKWISDAVERKIGGRARGGPGDGSGD